MTACTSPAGTSSDRPLRIGLSPTETWRLLIDSIGLFSSRGDHRVERDRGQQKRKEDCARHPDVNPGKDEHSDESGDRETRARQPDAVPGGMYRLPSVPAPTEPRLTHPTLPSRLIATSFCASTANSIG